MDDDLNSRKRARQLKRRELWGNSGLLPPAVAKDCNDTHQAILAVITAEIVRNKHCVLSDKEIADQANVASSTVRHFLQSPLACRWMTINEDRLIIKDENWVEHARQVLSRAAPIVETADTPNLSETPVNDAITASSPDRIKSIRSAAPLIHSPKVANDGLKRDKDQAR
jgi:hypothetical protein